MGKSARSLALAALVRIDHEGAYANLVLPAMLSRSSLSHADRRFATELVYGTTRRCRACDALVDRVLPHYADTDGMVIIRYRRRRGA
ncbi:MAG: transcription antitermination factor NusB [Acidimicrobiia bacterium]